MKTEIKSLFKNFIKAHDYRVYLNCYIVGCISRKQIIRII